MGIFGLQTRTEEELDPILRSRLCETHNQLVFITDHIEVYSYDISQNRYVPIQHIEAEGLEIGALAPISRERKPTISSVESRDFHFVGEDLVDLKTGVILKSSGNSFLNQIRNSDPFLLGGEVKRLRGDKLELVGKLPGKFDSGVAINEGLIALENPEANEVLVVSLPGLIVLNKFKGTECIVLGSSAILVIDEEWKVSEGKTFYGENYKSCVYLLKHPPGVPPEPRRRRWYKAHTFPLTGFEEVGKGVLIMSEGIQKNTLVRWNQMKEAFETFMTNKDLPFGGSESKDEMLSSSLLVHGDDDQVVIYDIETGEKFQTFPFENSKQFAVVSPHPGEYIRLGETILSFSPVPRDVARVMAGFF